MLTGISYLDQIRPKCNALEDAVECDILPYVTISLLLSIPYQSLKISAQFAFNSFDDIGNEHYFI
jgi:hypothetical protein